jgi:hypothetical protein
MLGADPDMGLSALRLWVAAGSSALLVFICALALDWTRTRTVARVSIVVVGAVLGATLAWSFLAGASVRDLNAERRDLEMRSSELASRTLAPGSALGCLDNLAGETVDAACEKLLFASPASVAEASAYSGARLTLLADIASYGKRGGGGIETAATPLRRALEADRFGFVAHVLAIRDGCTVDSCKPLELFHDASRVRMNLSGQTLDRYVDHYVAAWGLPGSGVADAGATMPVASAAVGQGGASKKGVDIDFPSSASIPPVSIMNPEPKTPPAANASRDGAPRGKKGAPAQAAAVPPPPAAPTQPAVDPVWTPAPLATAPSPQQAGAPQSTTGSPPVASAPVQLNPFPAEPQANAGAPARTQ